jgi:uncharacterized membrane protein YdbT with pleckstrin-like domain
VRTQLLPTETTTLTTRLHPITLTWSVLWVVFHFGLTICCLAIGARAAVDAFFFGMMLWAITKLAWKYANWSQTFLQLSTLRIIYNAGLLSQKTRQLPIHRITDFGYEQTWLGRIFGYGTFILDTAGNASGEDAKLRYIDFIPSSDDVYHHLCTLVYPTRRVEEFPDNALDDAT